MGPGITNVAGIPIPSTDPFFLGVVGLHVLFGLAAVSNGAGAMLSRKGSPLHVCFGRTYFWSLTGVAATMAALSAMRWSEDWPLFVLGTSAFASAFAGRGFVRKGQLRPHLAAMGASYILMLTAFYVDNGKNLPLWSELPPLAYWIVPSAAGLPLIAYYLWRLPEIAGRKSSPNSLR